MSHSDHCQRCHSTFKRFTTTDRFCSYDCEQAHIAEMNQPKPVKLVSGIHDEWLHRTFMEAKPAPELPAWPEPSRHGMYYDVSQYPKERRRVACRRQGQRFGPQAIGSRTKGRDLTYLTYAANSVRSGSGNPFWSGDRPSLFDRISAEANRL